MRVYPAVGRDAIVWSSPAGPVHAKAETERQPGLFLGLGSTR